MLSITEISIDVVSNPQKEEKSFTISPAARTSDPLFTVPAHKGIYKRFVNSSNSSTVVNGWTRPPLLFITIYVPTKA